MLRITSLFALLLLVGCVDPYEPDIRSTVDVLVVDGTINNLPEPQIIRLNRSKADRVTGRFGVYPVTKATIEVIVDSSTIIPCHETVDGSYQLPSDFKGQIGHAYQLRFTLSDGTHYESSTQIMPAVPPIARVTTEFNAKSLTEPLLGFYPAGHDVFVDVNDPADQHNYYRWDWKLWEKQDWCRTCAKGIYLIWSLDDKYLVEDCLTSSITPGYFVNDYPCRTDCWEILYSYALNLFDDRYSNGGLLTKRRVAQIPFYQHGPCLVEIRQSALTPEAYTYFKLFQDQTQNTGGLADTPPAAPVGNIQNKANKRDGVVGFFTASAISPQRQWIDRKEATGVPPGLFLGLNGRLPSPEGEIDPETKQLKYSISIPPSKYYSRPPTAVCVPSDSRTPFKPAGWRD